MRYQFLCLFVSSSLAIDALAPPLKDPELDAITAGFSDRRNGVRSSLCVATILRTECPLWVKSGHWGRLESCPLYPRKRTQSCASPVPELFRPLRNVTGI